LWLDGGFVPEAQLPVSDRGFRYGMSVFETLRIFNGTPGFVGPHLERLRSAALRCGFTAPEGAFCELPSLLSQLGGTESMLVAAIRWRMSVLRAGWRARGSKSVLLCQVVS
jgi:branched-subunit amino acid aminotransferase/4-amino-4-deoxychorismate lyase